jgi:heptosyltransferase-3
MTKKKSKKALFLKTKHIGDSIILSSSIYALSEEYESIDIVCFSESEDIFKMIPRVKNIFTIPRGDRGFKKLYKYFLIFKMLFNNRYDLIVQFSDDWRGALISRFLDVRLSVTRKSSRRGHIWHKSFRFVANVANERRPAAEQDVDLLRKIQLYDGSLAPRLNLTIKNEAMYFVEHWLVKNRINLSKPVIIIHAFSRWKFKEIPIQQWIKLIDSNQLKRYQVILSGSIKDYRSNLEIGRAVKKRVAVVENFSLLYTAALFSKASLVLSIDSMATHMASALNIPLISVFGPTDESVWGAQHPESKVFFLSKNDDAAYGCRPCGLDGCGGSKISMCLDNFDINKILKDIPNIK